MTKQLMYLEDDESLARMTTLALQRKGFQVDHFSSISQLRACKDRYGYSYALLDLKLQDGNSLEFISDLSEKSNAIKIVLLTGYASIATAVQAIKLGAHNYLPKPASIEEILAAFEEREDAPANHAESMSLKRLEWERIQKALVENDGNITLTAKQLKMHRRTLQRKLNKRPVLE